jgi:single-stranded DNA-binding protein
MNPSIVLTGYVGKHPQLRPSEDSGITVPRYHAIAEVCEPSASRSRLRDGLVLPLYTRGDRQTERHQLVVLSRDQRRLRFPRRGDLVEVQGRPEILRFQTRAGAIREIHQVVVERLRVLQLGTALNRTIILTGYLGNRPEIRLTQKRSFTATWENRVAEMSESYDGWTRPREFMVLSLYTHANRQTQRHRLVVWSSDQICHRNIAFLRQGDLVKVKGRPEVYRYAAGGTTHELRQIVVERVRLLKRRDRPPEIP